MTALEYFNNAPDPRAYEVLWTALHGQRWMDVTATAMNRALEVHRMLAERSQHRDFRLPDLIIAATAEQHGATVLHYDADYDRIAAVTGQPVEWVTARGPSSVTQRALGVHPQQPLRFTPRQMAPSRAGGRSGRRSPRPGRTHWPGARRPG